MITRGLVWRLGLSQLLCWGLSYYLIGVLGERIVANRVWALRLNCHSHQFSGATATISSNNQGWGKETCPLTARAPCLSLRCWILADREEQRR